MDDAVTQQFSWGAWWLGLILSVVVGGIAAFFAGLAAGDVKIVVESALIGAIPGVVLIAISRFVSRHGFAQGMLVGAIIILAIGGACGAAMSDFTIR